MKNYRYTDEQMLGALRRVAVVVGSAALSGPVYMAHRRPDEPSRCAISTRFRTWREAVTIAGLETVSEAGGARRQCVVCGLEYSGLSGRNDRKTCSRSCYLVLRARYRRPQVTDQALRWRARQQADVSKCRRCGVESAHAAIEVHHRDGNPANNDVTVHRSLPMAKRLPPSDPGPEEELSVVVLKFKGTGETIRKGVDAAMQAIASLGGTTTVIKHQPGAAMSALPQVRAPQSAR